MNLSPLIRRVYRISNSRVFTLPKSWLAYIEQQTGQQVDEVAVEVDNVLTISPILSRNRQSSDGRDQKGCNLETIELPADLPQTKEMLKFRKSSLKTRPRVV